MFIGILARELTKQSDIDNTLKPLWDNNIFLDINSKGEYSLIYTCAEKELGNNFHIVVCDKIKGRNRDSFEYGKDKTDNFKHLEPIGALWFVEDGNNIYVGNIDHSAGEVLMTPEGKRKERYITDIIISEEMFKYLKETYPDKKILINPDYDFLKDYIKFNDNVEFMNENFENIVDDLIDKYVPEHTDDI